MTTINRLERHKFGCCFENLDATFVNAKNKSLICILSE